MASYYPAFAVAGLACIGFVLLLTPTGSLVIRFRRARGTERQQLRWVPLAVPADCASAITSGGKREPAKADRGTGQREVLLALGDGAATLGLLDEALAESLVRGGGDEPS